MRGICPYWEDCRYYSDTSPTCNENKGMYYSKDKAGGCFRNNASLIKKKSNTIWAGLVLFSILAIFITALPLCSASLGTFKQGDCVPIVTSLNATAVNISVLTGPAPNATILLSNVIMTKSGFAFNYTFCDTSKLGTYTYAYCDSDGNCGYSNDFEITGNGKKNASGGVIVLFVVIFLFLVGITAWLSIYTFGHLMTLDFDLLDLAFDWGLYFVIIALYILEQFYLGNTLIETYLIWFMMAGGFMLVIVPVIALVLSMTFGTLSKKKMSVRVPKRFFYNK